MLPVSNDSVNSVPVETENVVQLFGSELARLRNTETLIAENPQTTRMTRQDYQERVLFNYTYYISFKPY